MGCSHGGWNAIRGTSPIRNFAGCKSLLTSLAGTNKTLSLQEISEHTQIKETLGDALEELEQTFFSCSSSTKSSLIDKTLRNIRKVSEYVSSYK